MSESNTKPPAVGRRTPPAGSAVRVLRLTLKRRWFDMIASGEKKEEYREHGKWIASRVNANKAYDVVEFTNGYGPAAPQCVVEYLGYDWAEGNPEWGAIPGKRYVVIRLGRVIFGQNDSAVPTASHES